MLDFFDEKVGMNLASQLKSAWESQTRFDPKLHIHLNFNEFMSLKTVKALTMTPQAESTSTENIKEPTMDTTLAHKTKDQAVKPSMLTSVDGDTPRSRAGRSGKTVHFNYHRSLSERAQKLTAESQNKSAEQQERAVNSAYGSLQMVRSRLEEMRVISVRAQDEELSEQVRTKLAERFEKLKGEVALLSQDFKTSLISDNVRMS